MTENFFKKIPIKILFWIHCFIGLIFGLAFMSFPNFLLESMGFSLNEDGLLMSRLFGVTCFGLGIFMFLIRNIDLSKTRESILIMNSINMTGMSIALTLYPALIGPPLLTNVMLWLTNVMHYTMLALYLFFLIRDWKEVRALGKEEE